MAGPIQTAIGQALGAVAGAVALGKKFNDDERQAAKEAADAEAKKKKDAETAAKTAAKEKELAEEKAAKEKSSENKSIAEEKAAKKEVKAAKKAEKEEASAVATEADLISLGASPEAAEAYRIAQQRGITAPNRMIFDTSGQPLATYSEMATILADESLSDLYSSRLRTRNSVKTRRELLRNKSHKQNVREAVIAQGGTYGK